MIYIMLNAKVVPPEGGKTGFIDMRKVYDDADDQTREWLDGATIRTVISEIEDFSGSQEAKKMSDVIH